MAGSICCMSTISVCTLPSVPTRVAVPFDMFTRLYVLQEGKVLSVSKQKAIKLLHYSLML